jgi:hypothetical protein
VEEAVRTGDLGVRSFGPASGDGTRPVHGRVPKDLGSRRRTDLYGRPRRRSIPPPQPCVLAGTRIR